MRICQTPHNFLKEHRMQAGRFWEEDYSSPDVWPPGTKRQHNNTGNMERQGAESHWFELKKKIYLGYEPQRTWETMSHQILFNMHRKLGTKSIQPWKLAGDLENHEVEHASESSWGYSPKARHRRGEAINLFCPLECPVNFLANLCLLFAETTANYFIYNWPKTSSPQQWALLKTHIGTQTPATLCTHIHTIHHMYARNMLWKDGAGIWSTQREQRTFVFSLI